MSEFTDDIKPIVTDVMVLLRDRLRETAAAQGHNLSGKLSESIEFEVSEDGADVIGRMYAEDYSAVLEFGVKAERVPYGGGGGKGGTSLYIQGLIGFWELRGLAGREAVDAAFATATVHAREGMPTRASSRFSSTGDRTGFIRTAIEASYPEIGKMIEERYGQVIELNFANSLGQYGNIQIK